jgi:hypothetical protein
LSPVIDSDAVVYVVYQNGSQAVGSFDKFASSGGKRWAFNYLTGADVGQNLAFAICPLFLAEPELDAKSDHYFSCSVCQPN